MTMDRRLGRGLSSLLGGVLSEETTPAPAGASSPEGPRIEVEVGRIDPNPYQPRQTFDPIALEELRDSIRQHGILQPVVLRPVGDRFELVAGERRLRAARMAGLDRVPAVVRGDLGDHQMLELALVENVQRRDLDALERARGYQRMMEALGLTQAQVADKVGLRRSTVANHLRLLELPPKAQEAIAEGLITMGHARAMLSIPDRADIESLVERTAREGLSVRRVEELARAAAGGAKVSTPPPSGAPTESNLPPWARELEGRIREHLGTRVQVRLTGPEQGRIVIHFFNRPSLDRAIEVLAPRPRL